MLREAYRHEGTRVATVLAGRLVPVALAMFDGVFLAVQNEPRLRYSTLLLQAANALEHLAGAELRRRAKKSPRALSNPG